MAGYYCIARARTGVEEDNSDRVMLYRFTSRAARDAYVKLNEYRLSVSRDIARLIFPELRGEENNWKRWCSMKVLLRFRKKGMLVQELTTVYYFCELGLQRPVYANYQLIPNRLPGGREMRERIRKAKTKHDLEKMFMK